MFAPPYDLTCDEQIPDAECWEIAEAALQVITTMEGDRGDLKTVEVLLVEDCRRVARAMFQPSLADPTVTGCWAVQSVWQRAQPSVVVARMAGGELVGFP